MKKIKYSLLSLLAVFGMASCSNDYEYTPAEKLASAQVYFPVDMVTSANVNMEDSLFVFQVSRVNTADELTVNFDVKGDSLLELPKSVKFAAGVDKVEIQGKALVSKMGYDNPQTFTMSIADASYTTPYGGSALVATVSAPAPWKSLGQATITEDLISTFWGTKGTTWKCEIQENELYPGFYRLVNPYTSTFPYNEDGDYDASKDYYLEIHAENPNAVYINKQELGFDWGYGMISINSMAGYYMAKGNALEDIAAAGYCGTLSEGEITFPVQGLLVSMADYNDGAQYYANGNGLFSVLLPGYVKADYSAEVAYAGIFTGVDGSTSACGNLVLGADASDARAVVMTQDDDPAAVADAIAAGELDYTAVSAGTIMVPFDTDALDASKLQIIVAVLSASGDVKNIATTNFEYFGGAPNPWKSLGVGTYTDDAIITMFGQDEDSETPFEPVTYEVEILENTETPGLYRLMDVYAPGVHPYGTALANGGITMPALGTHYLEVNATVADEVYIATQNLGIDFNSGDGEIGILTNVYRYMSKYETSLLKEYGYFGVKKGREIKFPAFYINGENDDEGHYQGVLTEGGQLAYYCGTNAKIEITLPGAVSEAKRQEIRKKNNIARWSSVMDLKLARKSFEMQNKKGMDRNERKIGFKKAENMRLK